ncbi:MAG: hypothetical protein H7X97_04575 [Opitutaceae bacterium]|nr:hypothetical protein [Verrucomicrobiales bacterium]
MFSLLAIVAAGAFLSFRYFGPAPKVERRSHAALGQALAEQTAKLLGQGGRVTLIAPDTSAFRYPGAEVQLKAFHQALRRAGHGVAATNWIRLDPLRVVRVPPGDFAEILRKQTDADVVVSFMGPPVMSSEQKARVGQKRPKVIAICSGDMPRQINLPSLFAENFLHAAVVSRPRPGAPPKSDDSSAWFDHLFQWITPQNQAELSALETVRR